MDDSAAEDLETTPVEHRSQLVEYLEAGCKPPQKYRLGTEQERFVYRSEDLSPAVYDGAEPGIRSLLENMTRFGWKPIHERGLPIGLCRGNCTITLEPGGQLELSTEAVNDVHQVFGQTETYYGELNALAGELGLSFLALGYQPNHPRAELPWMPKARYRIMRAYMTERGELGLDMMQSTAAIQVTADFGSESDMVKKLRVALALQPVVTALFANSPFVRGQFSGYLSFRSVCWADTDPERCGAPPFVFRGGMGFELYTDYVLDVPMYFVIRDGKYIDASGMSFRDFLNGRLSVLPGERPTLRDWENHLTTVFPQVRLKRYLEMRGADAGGSMLRVTALAALWAGLLYDVEALDAAWERVRAWTPGERQKLDFQVAKHGFKTPFRNGTVQDLSLWMLDLSRQGLKRRDVRNQLGKDESTYLAPLQESAERGQTFAEDLLRRFQHEWRGNMDIAMRAMCEEALS
jgi:glutamate--cysteine ligase